MAQKIMLMKYHVTCIRAMPWPSALTETEPGLIAGCQ